LQAAQAVLARQSGPVTATDQAYALFYNVLDQQAHLWAFVDAFRLFGLMVLCCIPLIFLFKTVRHPGATRGSPIIE